MVRQERGLEFLHMHVQAQIGAVHRHGGEVAARCRIAGRSEHPVRQAGIDHRGVLHAVVQRHPVHAPRKRLAVDVLVEAELQGRLGGALRADEPLLAHAHVGVRLTVDGHRGAEPRVDAGKGPREAVLLDLREHVSERACLVAQRVPVIDGDVDADVEHAVEGEIGGARIGLGVVLGRSTGRGGSGHSVKGAASGGSGGGAGRGRECAVVGCVGAASSDQCQCDERSGQAALTARLLSHSSSLPKPAET